MAVAMKKNEPLNVELAADAKMRGGHPLRSKSRMLILRDFSVQGYSKQFKGIQSYSKVFRCIIFLFLCPRMAIFGGQSRMLIQRNCPVHPVKASPGKSNLIQHFWRKKHMHDLPLDIPATIWLHAERSLDLLWCLEVDPWSFCHSILHPLHSLASWWPSVRTSVVKSHPGLQPKLIAMAPPTKLTMLTLPRLSSFIFFSTPHCAG
jgi:hypothetical protein